MNWRRAVRTLLWIAAICGVLVGIVFIFFDTWTIPGDDPQLAVSIEPNLSVGDVLLVLRSTGASDGALVRCTDPDAPARFVVGRAIGQTGDTIEFVSGTLLVNHKTPTASAACDPPVFRLKNPATQDEEDLSCSLEDFAGATHMVLRSAKNPNHDVKTEVETGKVFLISDNRGMHLDSRDFNALQPATCKRIAFRLWSAGGWSDAKKRLTVLW